MTIELVGRLGRLLAISVAGVLLMNAVVSVAAQGPTAARKPKPTPPADAVAASTLQLQPANPPPWNGYARRAPFVESVEPSSNGAPINSSIVITFSQPMIAASVEQSFAMRPAVDGRMSWPDLFTFRFQPYQLAHGAAYEVRVGGRSRRGGNLSGRHVWHFSTVFGPPLVSGPGPNTVKVPILTYHYIRTNPDYRDRLGFALSVTPADFAAQMDWLAGNGFHTVTPGDIYAYLSGTRGLPSRPVILTFDDGYADFYNTALPILKAHDFTAVTYVISGFIGRPGYMTAAQILEADRAGMEIGSHTVDHANLARSSAGNVMAELTASKQALEQLLGHPVLSFCYPSGRYNGGVVAAVRAAGYMDATTTVFGYVHYLSDRYTWSRLRISGGENLTDFAAALLSAS